MKGKNKVQVMVEFVTGGELKEMAVSLFIKKGTNLKRVHKTHRASIFGSVLSEHPDAKHLTPIRVKHGAIVKYRRTQHHHARINASF